MASILTDEQLRARSLGAQAPEGLSAGRFRHLDRAGSLGHHPTMMANCYIEEYTNDDGELAVQLREKETGRSIEIIAFTEQERDDFLAFLMAPRLTGEADKLVNLYEASGLDDFVVIEGNSERQDSETIQFTYDGALSYFFA